MLPGVDNLLSLQQKLNPKDSLSSNIQNQHLENVLLTVKHLDGVRMDLGKNIIYIGNALK